MLNLFKNPETSSGLPVVNPTSGFNSPMLASHIFISYSCLVGLPASEAGLPRGY